MWRSLCLIYIPKTDWWIPSQPSWKEECDENCFSHTFSNFIPRLLISLYSRRKKNYRSIKICWTDRPAEKNCQTKSLNRFHHNYDRLKKPRFQTRRSQMCRFLAVSNGHVFSFHSMPLEFESCYKDFGIKS